MLKRDFCRSKYDSCMYFARLKENSLIYLLIYVDDMLIACKHKAEILKLKDALSSEFEMKDLGNTKRILGMDISRDRNKSVLTLFQEGYLKKIVDIFGMNQAKLVSTPIGAHFKLMFFRKDEEKQEASYMRGVPYSNAVGSIMYAMVSTRPDLAYGVGLVSRFMSKPGRVHW